MAFKASADLKTEIVNEVVRRMAGTLGTGGTCVLKIYPGTQPDNAETAYTLGPLCIIEGIGWGDGTSGATAGSIDFVAGRTGTAISTGQAGWARMETFGTGGNGSSAVFRVDGECGLDSTCAFVFYTLDIEVGDTVTVYQSNLFMT